MQPAEEFSTLVHELAHEMLHRSERRTLQRAPSWNMNTSSGGRFQAATVQDKMRDASPLTRFDSQAFAHLDFVLVDPASYLGGRERPHFSLRSTVKIPAGFRGRPVHAVIVRVVAVLPVFLAPALDKTTAQNARLFRQSHRELIQRGRLCRY